METKLTLKFEKSAIDDLKAYAREQGTSVSRLIEDYVKKVAGQKRVESSPPNKLLPEWLQEIQETKSKYPPVTATDEELKKDYHDFIKRKYL